MYDSIISLDTLRERKRWRMEAVLCIPHARHESFLAWIRGLYRGSDKNGPAIHWRLLEKPASTIITWSGCFESRSSEIFFKKLLEYCREGKPSSYFLLRALPDGKQDHEGTYNPLKFTVRQVSQLACA